MNNVKGNIPQAVLPREDKEFSATPFNADTLSVAFGIGNPSTSYTPTGGEFNTLEKIQRGKSLLLYPKQDMKEPAFLCPSLIGSVVDYDFQADDTNIFDKNIKSGENFTFSSEGLTYSAVNATAPFSHYRTKARYVSENYQASVVFKINGAPTGMNGFSVWAQSNGSVAKFGYYAVVAPGQNKIKLYSSNISNGNQDTLLGEAAFTFASNETCILEVVQKEDMLCYKVRSLTNVNKSCAIISLLYNLNYSAYQAGAVGMSNTHSIGLQMYGGNFLFSHFSYSSHDYKNINAVFVGDSLMKGYYVSALEDRYVYRIFNRDRTRFTLLAGGGDTSADVLLRLNEIKSCNPLYAILCIGTNDHGLSVPVSTFSANINQIDAELKADDIATIWCTLPAGVNDPGYNAAIHALNSKVVDFYTATLNTASGSGLKPEFNGGDGAHLNSYANQALADLIKTECPEIL